MLGSNKAGGAPTSPNLSTLHTQLYFSACGVPPRHEPYWAMSSRIPFCLLHFKAAPHGCLEIWEWPWAPSSLQPNSTYVTKPL